MFRVGNIVQIPSNSLYGKYALISKVTPRIITVHTSKFELTYEPNDLVFFASLRLEKRTYTTMIGLRFRVCTFLFPDESTKEAHVCVRDVIDIGSETRAWFIRLRAVAKLNEAYSC